MRSTFRELPTEPGTAALPGNRLVFEAEDVESGFEPWITDGTPSGTHRIVNLSTASDPSQPKRFSANGDRVLFSAQESVHGPEPWVSGGNAGNTQMVVDDQARNRWQLAPCLFSRPTDSGR